MTKKLKIKSIWWRNVQLGEFYNIERHHQIKGGGGSLYIEIPASIVPVTLDFLGAPGTNVESFSVTAIQAYAVGKSNISGPIEFHPKSGGRMRIARQNRQQPHSQRHPAWTSDLGFPRAPDDVGSKEEARPYFPEGGLRIYIARTTDGNFYAGFTAGPRPKHMAQTNPMWELYSDGVGGLIEAN